MADFLRTYVYVDGYNIRKAVQKHRGPEFVQFKNLAGIVLAGAYEDMWLGTPCRIARVWYYDAEPDEQHPDRDKVLRYFAKLDELEDVHVRHGFLRHASSLSRRTQKGVDVLLAVDMLEHVHRGVMDVAVLFSGDADFAPLVEAVVHNGPRVVVVSYSDCLASDLRLVADVTVEIDKLKTKGLNSSTVMIPELKLD
ncbi:MAG: NYN domain-containing protein [Chloroflexi bacterium]|nr:NYN domain-containing protein [Chloroflexota bacterium]